MNLPLALSGWGTLEIDPPWRAKDRGTRLAPEHSDCGAGYRTMSDAEILALDVGSIAARDAHLYLWAVDWKLDLALQCIEAWGFVWKRAIVWVKRGTSGKLAFGAGHYYRTAHELCLFAVRGKLPAATRRLRTVFEAPRGVHSAKPAALYAMAEQVSPAPRLELFARAERPGWVTWGDEAPAFAPAPTPRTDALGTKVLPGAEEIKP